LKGVVVNTQTLDRTLMARSGASGSASAAWIPAFPGWEFQLTDGSAVLDSKLVFGKTAPNAAFKGGTQYHWFYVDRTQNPKGGLQFGEPWPYGIVQNYHKTVTLSGSAVNVRALVQSQLQTMYQSGQRTLGLGFFHQRQPSAWDQGTVSDSSLKSNAAGASYLSLQVRSNLANFLADVRTAGFPQILFTLFPGGANDPGHCSGQTAQNWSSLAAENRGVIKEVRQLLVQSGIKYYLDLANENALTSNLSPPCTIDYVNGTWTWYAQNYGNPLTKVVEDSVGFSMIASDTWRIDNTMLHAANTYSEWLPVALNLHLYGKIPGSPGSITQTADMVYAYAAGKIQAWPKRLRERPWIIGETHSDSRENAVNFASAVGSTGRPPLFLIQWPTKAINGNDQYYWYGPPHAFSDYSSNGF
jgi:hypothetical protein